MDSRVSQVEQLQVEGRKFTFQNACFPDEDGDRRYGGEDTPEWLAWKTRVLNVAKAIGSEGSPAVELAKSGCSVPTKGNYPREFDRAHGSLLKALEVLRDALQADAFGEIKQAQSASSSPTISNKVFVVHGHDNALKVDVESLLHQLGLEPIVLHRQPDRGQTLIEKFEQHSDVGFVFVLLTPDEVAYLSDQQDIPDEKRSKEFRSRPNVIFEFGYFVGKLGRSRVCCIYKGEVVLPSDISGLLYKKVDGSIDSQAYSIIRELKAAGYQVRI